ncbi:MAG: Appr-1-p processing protein [Myxococcales bacterium]|jgi:O-acetyl-ADP-ribose deacetylase (regulator of RNase III)|nr:Appr-1-p processing protein [Myxococcales bacterium]
MKGNITYVGGDATAPRGEGKRIICHVCNDAGGWGRGFVVALSARWREPESRYRAWHAQGAAGDFRLGAIQVVEVDAEVSVANMIAQRGTRPKAGVPPIRYDALRECLVALAEHGSALGASVHMPRIGCGLAGGTWSEVEAIVTSTLCEAGLPVIVYDLATSDGRTG